MRFVVVTALMGSLLACLSCLAACPQAPANDRGEDDAGTGEGEAGEGEGEGRPLDVDQVRLGSALAVDAGGPVVADEALPTPPDGIALFDLGDLAVDVDGLTGTVLVDVDARVRGLTFVVYGRGAVIVARAENGAGDVVVDDAPLPTSTPGFVQMNALAGGFPSQFASPSRVLPGRAVGAFPLPSTPDVPLSAGTWSVRLGHFTVDVDDGGEPVATPRPEPVRVLVLVRTARVAPGSVGLALHFTGGQGLDAGSARLSPAFGAAIDLLQRSWGDVGVDASDVEFFDVDGGADFRTVVLDEPRCDGGDLDDLVQRGVPDRINLFFVERFECGPFGPFLLGLSPGVPGVPFATGTNRSGVVVATSFLASDPEGFAVALAHESAHFLGLFHTQENDRFSDVDLYDNVADTGESPASRDNLMFFEVARITSTSLSPSQGQILQASPWVHP